MRLAVVVMLAACGSPKERPIVRRPTFINVGGGPVIVVGLVGEPGRVPWFPGMGLRYTIQAAGGITRPADPMVEIRRRELGQLRTFTTDIDMPVGDIELAPGDVVFVKPLIPVPGQTFDIPADARN